MPWAELVLDLIALLLVAGGIWFVYPPAGLIVGGIGVAWLSIGLKARRGYFAKDERAGYKAVEVED